MNSKKNFFIVFLSGLAVLIAAGLTLGAIFSPSDTATGDRIADQSERVVTGIDQPITEVTTETPENTKIPSDDPAVNGNAPVAGTMTTIDPGDPVVITLDKDLTGTPGLTGMVYVYMEADIAAIEISREGYDALVRQAGFDPAVSTQIYLTKRAAESAGYKASVPYKTFVLSVQADQ